MLEIEPPISTIHVGRFGMDVNGQFWREQMVAPIECSKRVDLCRCMYKCIADVGDERQDLIPSFVAWIDICDDLLLEDFVEALGEAICLQMVSGHKHLLDT